MRRLSPSLRARLLAALLLALAAVPLLAGDGAREDATAIALRTLDRLDAGDYAAVVDSFTPEAKAAIDADGLRQVWTGLPGQLGTAQGRGDPVAATQGRLRVVSVPLHHARGTVDAVIALDADDRVAGLRLQPPAAPAPAAALPAGLVEHPVEVGAPGRALPGTLTLPAGAGRFPALVLVHGSGPQDRDQTLGPNRPFRDIAHGLAARGIAVLRYDKRSRVRPQNYAGGGFGVDDEVTGDALAALALLRTRPEVDAERVFVLGHSLGGMLAPRIAGRAGAAGAILFAAPARPLLDILVEQSGRMAAADGEVSAAERQAIDALVRGIARLRAGEDLPAPEAPLGLDAAYWRSIEAVAPVAEAGALARPLLLLQGGRDIQVTADDWRIWQAALGDAPRATLRTYPALNHLGIAGEGPGAVADYATAGHVDAGMLDDIAAWIGRTPE